MIVKRGNQYLLVSKRKGNILGVHPSEASAKSQEAAINIAKARRAGHRIPKP